jgi:hypothetical protein
MKISIPGLIAGIVFGGLIGIALSDYQRSGFISADAAGLNASASVSLDAVNEATRIINAKK